MSHAATGSPYAATIFEHSHSFSTDVRMSACMFPTRPSGSLKICVVGVLPAGSSQRLPWRSSAVFSCAPAIDRRNSPSGSAWPGSGAAVAWRSTSATAASSSAVPSMACRSTGVSSGGSSCSAPTQSRPIDASSSNGAVEPSR